jgi:hypothetical protein
VSGPGETFQPSLMFASEARTYQNREPSSNGRLLVLPSNIRSGLNVTF